MQLTPILCLLVFSVIIMLAVGDSLRPKRDLPFLLQVVSNHMERRNRNYPESYRKSAKSTNAYLGPQSTIPGRKKYKLSKTNEEIDHATYPLQLLSQALRSKTNKLKALTLAKNRIHEELNKLSQRELKDDESTEDTNPENLDNDEDVDDISEKSPQKVKDLSNYKLRSTSTKKPGQNVKPKTTTETPICRQTANESVVEKSLENVHNGNYVDNTRGGKYETSLREPPTHSHGGMYESSLREPSTHTYGGTYETSLGEDPHHTHGGMYRPALREPPTHSHGGMYETSLREDPDHTHGGMYRPALRKRPTPTHGGMHETSLRESPTHISYHESPQNVHHSCCVSSEQTFPVNINIEEYLQDGPQMFMPPMPPMQHMPAMVQMPTMVHIPPTPPMVQVMSPTITASYDQRKTPIVQNFDLNKNSKVIVTETNRHMPRPGYMGAPPFVHQIHSIGVNERYGHEAVPNVQNFEMIPGNYMPLIHSQPIIVPEIPGRNMQISMSIRRNGINQMTERNIKAEPRREEEPREEEEQRGDISDQYY